jgi:hypothetical protein
MKVNGTNTFHEFSFNVRVATEKAFKFLMTVLLSKSRKQIQPANT